MGSNPPVQLGRQIEAARVCGPAPQDPTDPRPGRRNLLETDELTSEALGLAQFKVRGGAKSRDRRDGAATRAEWGNATDDAQECERRRKVGVWPISTAGTMCHSGQLMKAAHKNHPSHSEIATQAQIIWELRGRPEGQDEEIWLTAENELRYDRKLNFAATRDRASALERLDAKSDAVQKELSELFPEKNSDPIREELLPSNLNEDR